MHVPLGIIPTIFLKRELLLLNGQQDKLSPIIWRSQPIYSISIGGVEGEKQWGWMRGNRRGAGEGAEGSRRGSRRGAGERAGERARGEMERA
jgi:hypothetical protein